MTKEEFLDILEELQITKHDVKYLLGLSHDVDEVIKYSTKKSDRVRRTANGKNYAMQFRAFYFGTILHEITLETEKLHITCTVL